MPNIWRSCLIILLFLGQEAAAKAPAGLDSFSSRASLQRYLDRAARINAPQEPEATADPLMPPPGLPVPVMASESTSPSTPEPTGASDSITNNQIAGVDEGDIVKVSGDWLIVLRRGRLFTISLQDHTLKRGSMIDAYPPGVDAHGDWYDEMLVAGNRVVVIGYSYPRGGTQIVRFNLASDGKLSFEDAYHLRSSDYYSSRNYASRLIGSTLYLYAPLPLGRRDLSDSLPAMRKWIPGRKGAEGFVPTITPHRVYLPRPYRRGRDVMVDTLHTVTMCDLAATDMTCRSTGVLGGWSRSFFVSQEAVYIWIGEAWRRERAKRPNAFLYRVPLDGTRPGAVAARGQPIDQFSFATDTKRDTLHVVARAFGAGDAMWSPEITAGKLALLTIPASSFGNGAKEVARKHYTPLPNPTGNGWDLQNRFVGDHLLYTGGSTGTDGDVTVVPLADRVAVRLRVPHGVDRLDAIGKDAIAIGSGRDGLGFTPIALSDDTVRANETFVLAGAQEAESRSHGFFFNPSSPLPAGGGILGLPVVRNIPTVGDMAGLILLSRTASGLANAGELQSQAGLHFEDGCVASCTDWYGNARPIFYRNRILALLGYELVEGSQTDGQIRTAARLSFEPEKFQTEP